MVSVTDKVVIVTGGSQGIGAAVVKEFMNEGAKYIAIFDIDEEACKISFNAIINHQSRCKIKFIKCDVSDDNNLTAAIEEVISDNGHIDVVVNNAGVTSEECGLYKKAIEINFTAVVTSTIKVLDLMRKDKGGKGGTVINISSLGALTLKCPTLFVYCAAKAAVLQFTSNIGMQPYFEKTNVRMICVCFGLTETNIIQSLKSFDPEITECVSAGLSSYPLQSAESAAKGLMEVYKNGNSGSTWLINSSKTTNISEKIQKAYEIMSADTI